MPAHDYIAVMSTRKINETTLAWWKEDGTPEETFFFIHRAPSSLPTLSMNT
jgi:hypothetical protein